MKRLVLATGTAVLVLGFATTSANAQCGFEHPLKSPLDRVKLHNSVQVGLIPAFVSCGNVGGNTSNITTEGGVPSCAPPETFNQQAGSPSNGWMWDDGRTYGSLQMYPTKNRLQSPLNPPSNTVDVKVKLNLRYVIDTVDRVDGLGSLNVIARVTMKDRGNGPLTVVDFPLGFGVELDGGNASVRTTVNALLNDIGQPGLPGCAVVEIVSASVSDENGNIFAGMGTFLPEQH